MRADEEGSKLVEIPPEDSPLPPQEQVGNAGNSFGGKGMTNDTSRPGWNQAEPEGGALLGITAELLSCF